MYIVTGVKEAMALPESACWKEASDKEVESLRAHTAYDLVPIISTPPGQKSSARAEIKAGSWLAERVVVHEWGQVNRRHSGRTFGPFYMIQSIRMVLAIAADKAWTVWQLGVQTAIFTRTSRRRWGRRWLRGTRLRIKRRALRLP